MELEDLRFSPGHLCSPISGSFTSSFLVLYFFRACRLRIEAFIARLFFLGTIGVLFKTLPAMPILVRNDEGAQDFGYCQGQRREAMSTRTIFEVLSRIAQFVG